MKINKICTGDYNGTIKFINPKNGFSDRTIYYNSSQINLIRQIPFYSRIAVAAAPNILTYEVGSDNTLPLETYIGHKKCVTSLDFFGDRTKMASCSEDKTVKIWDFKLPNKVNEFINDEPLCGVNVIDDNTIMSCDYEGNLNLFDQRKHGLLKNNYIGRDISFTSISANTSKSLLAATDLKGDCFVFEMDKNYDLELIKRFSAHKSYNLRCGFNSASEFYLLINLNCAIF
ncbi:TOR complex subunit lst8 [Bonamia ostreae]|uniref:TOR complex subunit lst8 n=1 Tax=Bonamia ostreae TaxID=126728 RepID=A0ABV2AKV5_9EUKA